MKYFCLIIISLAVLAGRVAAAPSGPYPISGFWLFHRDSPDAWREVLERIHRLGADTVIQFGHRPWRRTREEIRAHPVFGEVKIEGLDLVARTQADLTTANSNNQLRYIFTFETPENFGPALLVCPVFDKRIEFGNRVIWRLVLPTADPTTYDLILVAGRKNDSVAMLLAEAKRLGMQVFVGMPAGPLHPKYPWAVWWGEPREIFLRFAERVLQDYAARHKSLTSFAGVYQTFELPAAERTLIDVLELYAEQHQLVRTILPGKRILVSPYWDARRMKATGVTPASVKTGIKLIARQDVDIIAPQDSRGTGKVGLFWPHEVDNYVDSGIVPVVGGSFTYGEAYYASTTDFFRIAREAIDELAEQEDIQVELWANVEAFEPGEGPASCYRCGFFIHIQRTTKERLDRAITFAGMYPSKLISFMWDCLYTCQVGHDRSLAEEIEADWQRPIVVGAFRQRMGAEEGIVVRGYHIVQGHVELTFYNTTDKIRKLTVPVAKGKINPHFGAESLRYPDRLQEVWVPLSWTPAQPVSRIDVAFAGPGGRSTHTFSLRP